MKHAGTALICAVLMLMLMLINGLAFAAANPTDSTHEFSARVIAVLDGDTVLVLRKIPTSAERHARAPVKIRLAKIDAPEKAQPYGIASRNSLIEMVLHRQVWVQTLTIDKYGRTVAQLEMDGLEVNEEMVRRGMAWEYFYYHSDRRYIALEKEARLAKRGLWTLHNPTPPWRWRKQHATKTKQPLVLGAEDFSCGSKHRCS